MPIPINGGSPCGGRNFDIQGTRPQGAIAADRSARGGGGSCSGRGGATEGSTDQFQSRGGIFGGQGAAVPPAPNDPSPFTNTLEQDSGTTVGSAKVGSGSITDDELIKATGGNQQLVATLKKVISDPEGAKVVRDALNKGTTFSVKPLSGAAGLTYTSSNAAPRIEIDDNAVGNISVLAHESAHAAYPGMDHTDVYNLGYRISDYLGVREPRVPGYENIE